MIYTALTRKAMKIAFEAHKNQVDKSGVPYIYHPMHLAEQMEDEVTACVALLHDVLEDTDVTPQQLRAQGFSEEILTALHVMTRDRSVPYLDYIRAVKQNKVAAIVKTADLKHNSDLSRLDRVTEDMLRQAEKYRKALDVLQKKEPTPQPFAESVDSFHAGSRT